MSSTTPTGRSRKSNTRKSSARRTPPRRRWAAAPPFDASTTRRALPCGWRRQEECALVARIEALISGHGLDEAVRRDEAYHAAGADAVLIHSKRATADEILRFAERWANRCPVVIVPTMYYATPTEVFRRAGISTVVGANHNPRAALMAMGQTSKHILADEAGITVEYRLPA